MGNDTARGGANNGVKMVSVGVGVGDEVDVRVEEGVVEGIAVGGEGSTKKWTISQDC